VASAGTEPENPQGRAATSVSPMTDRDVPVIGIER
jgi:hypothetical protein